MKLEMFFDYLCPYCYLTFHEFKEILPDYPRLSVIWRPCEVRPRPELRATAWEGAPKWLTELKPRIDQAGLLPINRPFSSGNYSDMAIQGLLCLEEQGADIMRYNAAVFAAVFSKGMDIENLEVLCDCAADAGGDIDAFRQAIISETYKKKQLELNQYAWRENALDSVPSFRLGDARLNAVYSVGVLKSQLANFLDRHVSR